MMEDESGFLSRENEEAKMQRIQKLLTKIFFDLNEKKVTTIVGKLTYFAYPKILRLDCYRGRDDDLSQDHDSSTGSANCRRPPSSTIVSRVQ